MRVIREPDTVIVDYKGVVLSGNRSFEILRVKGVVLTRQDLAKLNAIADEGITTIGLERDGVFVEVDCSAPPVQVQLDMPTLLARHLL